MELGFLEEQDTGYKIKVELVRRWLEKYPPTTDNEKLQEENNSHRNNNFQEPHHQVLNQYCF